MSLLKFCFEDKKEFIKPYTDKQKFSYLIYLIEKNNLIYLKKYINNYLNSELKLDYIYFNERFSLNNFDPMKISNFEHIKKFLDKDEHFFYFKINYESIYYLSSLFNNNNVCSFLFDYVNIEDEIIFYSTFVFNNFCFINYKNHSSFMLNDYFKKYFNNDISLLLYYLNTTNNINEYIDFLFDSFYSHQNYSSLLNYSSKFPRSILKDKINNYNNTIHMWMYEECEIETIKNTIISDIEKVHIQSLIMDF